MHLFCITCLCWLFAGLGSARFRAGTAFGPIARLASEAFAAAIPALPTAVASAFVAGSLAAGTVAASGVVARALAAGILIAGAFIAASLMSKAFVPLAFLA